MELKPEGLFEGMSPAELKKLAREMREVRHPQGAEIIIRGKEGVGFLVILEGEAEVTTSDGRHRTLGPGDYFGEIGPPGPQRGHRRQDRPRGGGGD